MTYVCASSEAHAAVGPKPSERTCSAGGREPREGRVRETAEDLRVSDAFQGGNDVLKLCSLA